MGSFRKVLFFIGLQLLAVPGYAEQINISSLNYWNTPDQTQMLFDLTSSPEHRVFLMNNPARLVIDMRNTHAKQVLTQPPPSHPLFAQVRTAPRNKTDLRIVVDLKRELNSKNMSLRTNSMNGHRLVIELLDKASANYAKVEQKEEVTTPTANIITTQTTDNKQITEKPVKESQKTATKKIAAIPVEKANPRKPFSITVTVCSSFSLVGFCDLE